MLLRKDSCDLCFKIDILKPYSERQTGFSYWLCDACARYEVSQERVYLDIQDEDFETECESCHPYTCTCYTDDYEVDIPEAPTASHLHITTEETQTWDSVFEEGTDAILDAYLLETRGIPLPEAYTNPWDNWRELRASAIELPEDFNVVARTGNVSPRV